MFTKCWCLFSPLAKPTQNRSAKTAVSQLTLLIINIWLQRPKAEVVCQALLFKPCEVRILEATEGQWCSRPSRTWDFSLSKMQTAWAICETAFLIFLPPCDTNSYRCWLFYLKKNSSSSITQLKSGNAGPFKKGAWVDLDLSGTYQTAFCLCLGLVLPPGAFTAPNATSCIFIGIMQLHSEHRIRGWGGGFMQSSCSTLVHYSEFLNKQTSSPGIVTVPLETLWSSPHPSFSLKF